MLDQITPLILTRDEEPNIGRTLAQLSWAREVLVVDSYSSDATCEIARSYPNVRLVQRTFDEHATQWNFGLEQVRTPWVLTLDADYFCPDDLASELADLAVPAGVTAFIADFRYAVAGHPLRGSLYPAKIVLARTEQARFWQDGHTQRLEVHGDALRLKTAIVHDDRKSFAAFIARQRRYMQREAAKLRSQKWSSLNAVGRIRRLVVVGPFAALFHALFVRGVILDGRAGLRYALERFVAELILSRELLRNR